MQRYYFQTRLLESCLACLLIVAHASFSLVEILTAFGQSTGNVSSKRDWQRVTADKYPTLLQLNERS